MRRWPKFNRFFANQLLYPILVSNLLACGIYLFRVAFSGSLSYGYLLWNLLLAWVPYGASIVALGLYGLYPKRWWMLLLPGAVWLIFFPNAPYIITDFYHLKKWPTVPLWYDIGLITIFAWTGCFLAVASLRTMQFLVKAYAGLMGSWIFVAISLGLGGVGVYLGRFLRWNSWDLLVHPRMVLKAVMTFLGHPLQDLRFIGFSLMFTAILLVVYLMLNSMDRIEKNGE